MTLNTFSHGPAHIYFDGMVNQIYSSALSFSQYCISILHFNKIKLIRQILYFLKSRIHGNRSFRTRSFRTQVILYPGHFVPKSFRTILVISYPLLFSIRSFRTRFGPFVPISYPVWSFRTYFFYFLENRFGHFVPILYCFIPKSFRTRSHFVPILDISYPNHFVPTSKLGTN